MVAISSKDDSLLEDVRCADCIGPPPPPKFFLPPPPCNSSLNQILLIENSLTCHTQFDRRRDVTVTNRKISIAVIIITAVTFFILAIVAAIIILRRRVHQENRLSKLASTDDANIYDDSVQAQTLSLRTVSDLSGRSRHLFWSPLQQENPQNYRQPSPINRSYVRYHMKFPEDELTNDAVTAEHIYHFISSEEDNTTSLERDNRPISPSSPHTILDRSISEEVDALTPFLRNKTPEKKDSTRSSCQPSYYLIASLGNSSRSPATTSASGFDSNQEDCERHPLNLSPREDLELSSAGTKPSHEKGLPPLPSRRKPFRFFLTEKPFSNKCLSTDL